MKISRMRIPLLGIFLSLLCGGWVSSAELAVEKSIPLFDPATPSASGWMGTSGSNVSTGAQAKIEGKKMVVTGSLPNQSYGNIYRSLEVDLDETPYMELDAESATHNWYLILKGDQLPSGFVRIQPDTTQIGVMRYDLRLVTGLSGKQSFKEIQLGISTDGSAGNNGHKLVINRFRLYAPKGGEIGRAHV